MRFSPIFHTKPLPEARPEEPAHEDPVPVAAPGAELPDELDARVRLVGEWQLDEGWA